MPHRLPLLLALPLLPFVLAAQTDTTRIMVAGTVLDPMRRPIEGVEVRIVGADQSVMSSAAGTFRLYAPSGKELLIQIRRPGYRAQLLKTTEDWSGTVLMELGVYELPEIQVNARFAKPAKYAGTVKYDDYFRRKRIGFGLFISREEIESRQPLQAVEIFQGRTGVRTGAMPVGMVGGSFVMFSRCSGVPPKINVYVDGRKQRPDTIVSPRASWEEKQMVRKASVGDMVNRVNPSDIELIEIFRGPGELPGEFNDGNCGAIAIWTRQGGR